MADWKFCEWERHTETDTAACKFIYTFSSETNTWLYSTANEPPCEYRLFSKNYIIESKESEAGKNNTKCSLKIDDVDSVYEGTWNCRLTLCKDQKHRGCESHEGSNVTKSGTITVQVFI